MGYAVHEEKSEYWKLIQSLGGEVISLRDAKLDGPAALRFAGYGVPAGCDWPDCDEEINRGLGFKCEEHGRYELMLNGEAISYDRFDDEPEAEEEWVTADGCGLYFCEDHREKTTAHTLIAAKPDTIEWVRHLLTAPSWATWRAENPARVTALTERDGAATPCDCEDECSAGGTSLQKP